LLHQTQVLNFLSRNLYGRYPKDSEFQNSEYEVHQIGLKDYSQNFSFLAFKGKAVGVTQISSFNSTGIQKVKKVKINRKLLVATEIGSTFFLIFDKLPDTLKKPCR
jgi:hypothetical protein